MKLREKLKNARKRIARVLFKFPLAFCEDVLEFAETVKDAREDGFTDEELEVLGEELRRLLGELRALRKG